MAVAATVRARNMALWQTLAVFVGGTVGTFIRALIELAWTGDSWPWATFVINLSGSFILGFLLTSFARTGEDTGRRKILRLGLGTGALGGYTTYSTFIIEGDLLWAAGRPLVGVSYLVASVVLGSLLAIAGVLLARKVVDIGGREDTR